MSDRKGNSPTGAKRDDQVRVNQWFYQSSDSRSVRVTGNTMGISTIFAHLQYMDL